MTIDSFVTIDPKHLETLTGGKRDTTRMVTVGDGTRVHADKAAELVCGKGWTLDAGGCHAPAAKLR